MLRSRGWMVLVMVVLVGLGSWEAFAQGITHLVSVGSDGTQGSAPSGLGTPRQMAISGSGVVPVFVKVPKGAASYTGRQPVRFGVPFARGALKPSHGVILVGDGVAIPADIRVTAMWDPPGSAVGHWVKWLLIDSVVDIVNGKGPKLHLLFGPGLAPAPLPVPMPQVVPGDVTIDADTTHLAIGPGAGMLGTFTLATDADGDIAIDAPQGVVVEKTGLAHVARIDSHYGGPNGHEATTRYYWWDGLPMVRIVHTFVWNADDTRKISGLRFARPVGATPLVTYGFTPSGAPYDTNGRLSGRQISASKVLWNDTDTVDGKLDGWLNVDDGGERTFYGLQDTWQQYPAGFAYPGGKVEVLMLGPPAATPIDLSPKEIAAPPVRDQKPDLSTWEIQTPSADGHFIVGHPELISPRGFAKTYTMTLWFGEDGVPPAAKNALVQDPVIAYASPPFAAAADVSSPMVAQGSYPALDEALQRVFEFVSKSTHSDAEREGDGLLGWLNYGNFPWQFDGHQYAAYRYLANQGKGASAPFWLLYLRSGDPAILRWAMANARCVSDVCTCHVPELGQFTDDADKPHAADWKMRGGVYSYSEIPFSFGPVGGALGNTEVIDSEYLILAYYVTGDERFKDVIRERVACTYYSRWGVPGTGTLAVHYPQDCTIKDTAGRELYNMLRELCQLYAASWDDKDPAVAAFVPTLGQWCSDTLSTTLFAQQEMFSKNGAYWFPVVTLSQGHYLDHSLIVASRTLAAPGALVALDRWESYLGRPSSPGYLGQAYGPASVWALAEKQRTSPSIGLGKEIDVLLRAMADVILPDGTFGGRAYAGMGPYFDEDFGIWARNMLAGEWALKLVPGGTSPTQRAPVPYVSAQMVVRAGFRHVFFVKKTVSWPIRVQVHLNSYNAGLPSTIGIRVWNPAGSSTTTSFPYTATEYHTWGLEGITLPLGATPGVYAIEVTTPLVVGRGLPVHASLLGPGQIVHYVELGFKPDIGTHAVTLMTPAFGGEVWMRPEPSATVRVHPHSARAGRTLLLSPGGAVLATSQIDHLTGSVPVYQELTYAAGSSPSPIRLVLGEGTANPTYELAGIRPYLAPTKADLFDPNAENPALVAALVAAFVIPSP